MRRDSSIWTSKQKNPLLFLVTAKSLSAKRVTASVFKRSSRVQACVDVTIVKMIKFPASAVRNPNRLHPGFWQLIHKSKNNSKKTEVGPNLKLLPSMTENFKRRLQHRRKRQQQISKYKANSNIPP